MRCGDIEWPPRSRRLTNTIISLIVSFAEIFSSDYIVLITRHILLSGSFDYACLHLSFSLSQSPKSEHSSRIRSSEAPGFSSAS